MARRPESGGATGTLPPEMAVSGGDGSPCCRAWLPSWDLSCQDGFPGSTSELGYQARASVPKILVKAADEGVWLMSGD